jgi:hypothetical protein
LLAAEPEKTNAPAEEVIEVQRRFERDGIDISVFQMGHYNEDGSNVFTLFVRAALPDGITGTVAVERAGAEVSRVALVPDQDQGVAEANGAEISAGEVVILVRLSSAQRAPLTLRFDKSK